MRTLTYRAAKNTDAATIDRIQCECGAEITERLGPGHWSAASNVSGVRKTLKTKSVYLVQNEAGEPVATFSVGRKLPSFWPRAIWQVPDAEALGVFGLAVLPGHQRQGIGTWIMHTIEDLAREQGCRFLRLDAYEANPRSVAFYRKLAYEERGRIVVGNTPLLCFEQEVEVALNYLDAASPPEP